jgi:hypothetical protein
MVWLAVREDGMGGCRGQVEPDGRVTSHAVDSSQGPLAGQAENDNESTINVMELVARQQTVRLS